MSILNRRYMRSVATHAAFYFCILILTATVVWAYLVFGAAVDGMKAYLDDYYAQGHVEGGQFALETYLTDDDIKDLEGTYGVQLERQPYREFEEDNYMVRVFAATDDINVHRIIEGHEIDRDDEILLSSNFMRAQNLAIGDTIVLGGIERTICGTFVRPDYIYMIESLSDTYHADAEFGIALVSDKQFEQFDEEQGYISVIYTRDNEIEFRTKLYDDYDLLAYVSADSNQRIKTPEATVNQYRAITTVILPALICLIVLIVMIVLIRKVESEQKLIGSLTALGYGKNEIVAHYLWFAAIPALLGSIIGIVAALLSVDQLAGTFYFKLEPIPAEYSLGATKLLIALVVPVIAYTAAAVLAITQVLRKDAVHMLSGMDETKKPKSALVGFQMHFKRKYKIRSLLGRWERTLALVVGITASGLIMLFGLMLYDGCRNYKDSVIDNIGSFTSEYYLEGYYDENLDDGIALLAKNFEVEGQAGAITLIGTDHNPYLNFETDNLGAKTYITTLASAIFNVGVGDVLAIRDPVSLDTYDFTITDIVDDPAESCIYVSRGRASEILDVSQTSYNLVMSDQNLEFSTQKVSAHISKDSMKAMIQEVVDGMASMVLLLVLAGILICIVTVYLMANMIVEENRVTISMLKVLGYKTNEINSLIINIFGILLPVVIVLALIVSWGICKLYFVACAAEFQSLIDPYLKLDSLLVYLGAIFASYYGAMLLLKRKVLNVDMVESLKDSRE